ncbi:hypothetical protein RJ55_00405 [Drechmeria coniospora]|nr:hypothetical protein RJ55_00405 [Drechmeria coniospora]
MATASPTPMAAGPGPVPARRTSQRQALRRPPSRPTLDRSDSLSASAGGSQSRRRQQHRQQQQQQYDDDSSEDEIPVPMKLSALTKALLNDGVPDAVAGPASSPQPRRRVSPLNATSIASSGSGSGSGPSAVRERRHLRSGSVHAADGSRSSSRAPSRESSPVRKRVVRLSNTPQSLNQMQPSHGRSTSTSRGPVLQRPSIPPRPPSRASMRDRSMVAAEERPASRQEQRSDVNTPAHGERIVRIALGSASANRSRLASSGPSSGRSTSAVVDKSSFEVEHEPPDGRPLGHGSVSRQPSTRSRAEDNGQLQSSMRVKRVGKIPGSFLSGPARRGRRRQSEEDVEDLAQADHFLSSQQDPAQAPSDEPLYYADGIRNFNSGSPVSGSAAARAIHRRYASNADLRDHAGSAAPASGLDRPSPRPVPPLASGVEEPMPVPVVPVQVRMRVAEMPSVHDQENAVAAEGKRSRMSVERVAESVPEKAQRPPSAVKPTSPARKPLAAVTSNTPHRQPHQPPPPHRPPPKMSVLDAATSTTGAAAGATTQQAKQRRNVLRVNGRCYTRLDCLGRGGSAKVYRVTAENGNMFALKRVSLENADETTVKGYKGEIDLLGKLSAVDRVIKLFDHEMNAEKQVLTLLMEMGELDLNKLLSSRQNPESARFDPVFVRFYWKEMLECLQSVHQYDIVHSDLKPANFVLVRGRLKLIDFGIANAIQTDETVNVHRETQIGTPNYMSPESLMDANNPRGGRLPGRPKLMKLGKPSDIWSLGCILYQMVYGLPPFGHIANQMARCQAIINWDHHVEFPSRAMGGVPVPPSLVRTLRRCLTREIHMRPTCDELLHETDPFLYPAEVGGRDLPIDEDSFARIIHHVIARCRDRMPTEAEGSLLPQAYWSSFRKATTNRTGGGRLE